VIVRVRVVGAATVVMSALGLAAAVSSPAGSRAAAAVTVTDRAGDQADGNYKRHPERPKLDLRRVIVRRVGRTLTIS
jgi:hypothetical protein